MFTGSAPAKAILTGEHFVVHGAPALAVPIKSLSLHVELEETEAQEPLPGHLGFCFWTAREALDRECSVPLSVQVRSSIPEGAGLGSSAALSLAMARAVAQAFLTPTDDEVLRRVSMECERQAHGKPSGIDTEVCLLGRPVWAMPGAPFEPLEGDGLLSVGLVVLDSGPGGATADMIARVGRFRDENPKRFQDLVTESRERSFRVREGLLTADVQGVGRLLSEQHRALQEIGVSTAGLDGVVDAALSAGAAGAKLSGAGGGGVALAVTAADEVQDLAVRLRKAGCRVLSAGPLAEPPPQRRLT